MKVEFTLYGAPRTKKNSNRLVGRRSGRQYVLPSKAWTEWRNTVTFWPAHIAALRAIEHPVNCKAVFYRDRDVGDACGYYQGLADILEYYRFVNDDKWIVSWDGSRLEKDAKRPRVEITLQSISEINETKAKSDAKCRRCGLLSGRPDATEYCRTIKPNDERTKEE